MASLPFSFTCCLFSYSCFLGMAQANAKTTKFSAYISRVFLVWVLGELSCSHVAIMASHHVHRAIMASHYVNTKYTTEQEYQIYNRAIMASHYATFVSAHNKKAEMQQCSQTRLLLISKLPIFWICWHIMGHIPQK